MTEQIIEKAMEITQSNVKSFVPNLKKSPNKRRFAMPQIRTANVPAFVEWVKKEHGVTVRKISVNPKNLIPVQGDFDADKVKALAARIMNKDKRGLVASDNHLVDGQHTWMGAVVGERKYPVFKFSVPYKELMKLMEKFPQKAPRKKLSEDEMAEAQEKEQLDEILSIAQRKQAGIRAKRKKRILQMFNRIRSRRTPDAKRLKRRADRTTLRLKKKQVAGGRGPEGANIGRKMSLERLTKRFQKVRFGALRKKFTPLKRRLAVSRAGR